MADTTDQNLAHLQERLAGSRERMFELAQAMRGHEPEHSEVTGEAINSGFPHSRLMRALMGRAGGVALGTAAVAATVLRPGWMIGALRLTPMLRPLLMRYVLPRLLGQR